MTSRATALAATLAPDQAEPLQAWLAGRSGRWWLDPRTKIAIVVVVNLVSMNLSGSWWSWLARTLAMSLAAILWCSLGRVQPAIGWSLAYLSGLALLQGARFLPGGWALLGGLGTMVVQFLPILAMASYAVASTQVSELVAALDRLKAPSALVIPLSVVLRFLPTIAEEHRGIADAMRLRGISWRGGVRNPITLLEYRVVPLLICVVRIGDDLTAAALTRGLATGQRTHICRSGFSHRDALTSLAALIPAAVLLTGEFLS